MCKKIFVLGARGVPSIQGGTEKHCEELYPRLAKKGYNITIFARTPYFTHNKRLKAWNNINIKYLWCPKNKHFETIIHTFLAALYCIVSRPDIVHIHNIGPALILPLLKLAGLKTVLTYHSVNYEHRKWGKFAKLLLKLGELIGAYFADRIIAVSQNIADMLEKKYHRHDISFIPNGTNLRKKKNNDKILKKYGLEQNDYIFTACRFVPEKALPDLINAYIKIKNPSFKLVIAGEADHESTYNACIKQMAARHSGIILTGFITGEELEVLFSNAALFALPSYSEGSPIALLEALSYGLPAIVSDIPATREIFLPDYRYFQPGDIETLSKKLEAFIKSGISEKEKNMHLERIKNYYCWEKIANSVANTYESLISRYEKST